MSESKDAAIEYFKILQNTINRMANNSFLLKGWIVTIFAAIVVLVGGTSPWVWLSAIFAIVLFWFLD